MDDAASEGGAAVPPRLAEKSPYYNPSISIFSDALLFSLDGSINRRESSHTYLPTFCAQEGRVAWFVG
eukprot:6182762-Pleurochrysis_carterae.AAC.2